jgi:hypothetical protein
VDLCRKKMPTRERLFGEDVAREETCRTASSDTLHLSLHD